MRTVCSFPGCNSGSASDKKRNKQHGVRNKAMFGFPQTDKKPFIRHKWEEVIGRKAKDTEVLCELHFRSEDVLRSYEVFLPNGIKHTMDRGRITIKPSAIPQNNQGNIVCPEDNICEKENIGPANPQEVRKGEPSIPDVIIDQLEIQSSKLAMDASNEADNRITSDQTYWSQKSN
ncbi:uncharacterized protein LOC107042023 [Diachasma alloeum]|uniref:uncharacterized protein LOC107042023 n=1 Tax=Diachasma alloeum TaxID=454923 RepID=UPI000738193A|nr:uncharacterized protein LOC107042023 [Diachasma alloeum]